LAGYYRVVIPNFSKTAKSYTNLLKQNEKFVWAETLERAFTQLRDLQLRYSFPIPRFTKLFVVIIDASLMQSTAFLVRER
jgi:hypothetical protein